MTNQLKNHNIKPSAHLSNQLKWNCFRRECSLFANDEDNDIKYLQEYVGSPILNTLPHIWDGWSNSFNSLNTDSGSPWHKKVSIGRNNSRFAFLSSLPDSASIWPLNTAGTYWHQCSCKASSRFPRSSPCWKFYNQNDSLNAWLYIYSYLLH